MKSKGLIFGIATGDALGVPVEFMSRKHLKTNPVVGMRAYGTHHQPAGTWSDDTSLSLCLVEQLIEGFDLNQLSARICDWYDKGYWTAHGAMFDVGIATRNAIDRLLKDVSPLNSGECDEYSNGNGSLMRILPLAFYVQNKPIDERFKIIKAVSGITHGHTRTIIGCFFAIEYLLNLLQKQEKFQAYSTTQNTVRDYLLSIQTKHAELELYSRILFDDISKTDESEIFSSGYILHTLEASLWAFLITDNFKDAVLKGINLGDDTDTIGSVTGAIAGLYYGFEQIPNEWIQQIARQQDIEELCQRFSQKFDK
ncbi:ADP-ribosylglycohydrolase family protein [Flectobacillus major]|jgi:ADP-ribosylglycohydrolase|uniref:ADP-ribosylglycohydrolase family protein n=1 Tax=Flectobacillus major TaxID=103 RepID=UPI00041C59EB|nr:ADP-ribosylglycohydrolase family protein [Flectobacillus major]